MAGNKRWFRRTQTTTWLAVALAVQPMLPATAATLADYERADRLRVMDPRILGGRVDPIWLHDGIRFYYEARGRDEHPGSYVLVDPRDGSKRPLFDAPRIAAALSLASGTTVVDGNLPKWSLIDGDARIAFLIGTTEYRCDLAGRSCTPASAQDRAAEAAANVPPWAVRSPDGKWDAFIWNYNVYIRPASLPASLDQNEDGPPSLPRPRTTNGNSRFGAALEDSLVPFQPTGQRAGCDRGAPPGAVDAVPPAFQPAPAGSIALTHDGERLYSYGPRWKGGAEVATLDADRYRPTHGSFAWSPDSRRLLTRREDIRGVGVYPLYSSTSVKPVDHSYYYAAPGDQFVPQYDQYVLDIGARTSVKIDVPPTGLVLEPGDTEWSGDSASLYVLSSDRGSKEATLSLVGAASGKARTIIRETSKTFVEMSNGGDDTILSIANAGKDIIWFSERDGWGHLYRYDQNGKLQNQIEQGAYSVAELTRVDEAKKQLYFTAWGKEPGIPYYRQLYRINFDGSGLTHLTPEPGDHFIEWMPSGAYFLDTMSAIDQPPVTMVRRADGTRVMEVTRGSDAALRELGWRPAEPFTVKARDGKTDLYGVMYRPSDFDPHKRYPIITNLYPGPFKGSVGRTWSFQGPDNYEIRGHSDDIPTHGEGMGQSLAELGFIVIKLDALGTARRSKAMQDYYYGHVLDNGLPDQIAAIKQLGARFSWIDTTRVGIFGHSGGGFSAAAGMLLYPDFFKVGVAESGNHDFRSYGWYWGEKYQSLMKTPAEADEYEAQANYKYAANLKGKLLLIHGDMDCNNTPAVTLHLVDALIKQDKDFDMLIVPDSGHQLPPYAMRRSWDYFVRNLGGETPPEGYKLLSGRR